MLLRKQTSYTQTFRATLDFTPSRSGYEAGVAIWWSIAAYASISVRLAANGNGREVHVRLPGAAEEAVCFSFPPWSFYSFYPPPKENEDSMSNLFLYSQKLKLTSSSSAKTPRPTLLPTPLLPSPSPSPPAPSITPSTTNSTRTTAPLSPPPSRLSPLPL